VNDRVAQHDYDVIVVGSGTSGATIARTLAKQRKTVLLLEQGTHTPLRESLAGMLSVAQEFRVGPQLKGMTASTVGGATSLYFGKCVFPTAETYRKLGVDLSQEIAEVTKELTIATLPDEFLTPQATRIRDSAQALGYGMKRNLMLIDQSKCPPGRYAYEAKWKARSYVHEAVEHGARLLTSATVRKVLVEDGKAVGVEYETRERFARSKRHRAYGKKIVLAAGALATPRLLMEAGICGVGDQGFFCHPAYLVLGTVRGLQGRDGFIAHFDLDFDPQDRIVLGDATMSAAQFRLVMLANLKWRHLFAHATTLAMGVALNDTTGGRLTSDGRYDKQLTSEELALLEDAGQVAVKVLSHAGATSIFRTPLMAGVPGGVLRIGEHLDQDLQTRIRNLYVCDHSLVRDASATPTVLLTCLGRYLAKHLIASLDGVCTRRVYPVAV